MKKTVDLYSYLCDNRYSEKTKRERSMTNQHVTGIIAGVDRVRWESAAGILTGLVERIDNAKNAAGDMIPWLVIRLDDRTGQTQAGSHCTRLAGLKDYLAGLKLEVLEK